MVINLFSYLYGQSEKQAKILPVFKKNLIGGCAALSAAAIFLRSKGLCRARRTKKLPGRDEPAGEFGAETGGAVQYREALACF